MSLAFSLSGKGEKNEKELLSAGGKAASDEEEKKKGQVEEKGRWFLRDQQEVS